MRRVLFQGKLLVAVFMLGFVTMWLKARSSSNIMSRATHELGLVTIENALASAVIDAKRGDYEIARQAASYFFTSVRAEMNRENDSLLSRTQREVVQSLVTVEDDIITLLARSEPSSADMLSDLYVSYRGIMIQRGSGGRANLAGRDRDAKPANNPHYRSHRAFDC